MQLETVLAQAFIREVIGEEVGWATSLADPGISPESKQKVFQDGPDGNRSLEKTYREWVTESGDVEPDDIEKALVLMDQVLFEVAKRLGTIKLQGLTLPRVVIERTICDVTVQKLASAYKAVRTESGERSVVFFFNNVKVAGKFRRDVVSVAGVLDV